MVDISTLTPGMKIKIVDEWVDGCRQNVDGLMDKWLGVIMTVRKVMPGYVKTEEDTDEHANGWYWYPPAIDYVVYEPDDFDFDPTAEELYLEDLLL